MQSNKKLLTYPSVTNETTSILVRRFRRLMTAADLSWINRTQFRTMCLLLEDKATEQVDDGKSALLSAISDSLERIKEFQKEIIGRKFEDDTPESRKLFGVKMEDERVHLSDVADVVDRLDELQAVALLVRVEEVLNGSSALNIEDRCTSVYKKMQAPIII